MPSLSLSHCPIKARSNPFFCVLLFTPCSSLEPLIQWYLAMEEPATMRHEVKDGEVRKNSEEVIGSSSFLVVAPGQPLSKQFISRLEAMSCQSWDIPLWLLAIIDGQASLAIKDAFRMRLTERQNGICTMILGILFSKLLQIQMLPTSWIWDARVIREGHTLVPKAANGTSKREKYVFFETN